MKTKLGFLAVALMAGGAMFAQPRVAVSIGAGGYGPGFYPAPAYAQHRVVQRYVGPRYDNVDRDHDRDDRDRRENRYEAQSQRFDNHGDERFDNRGANGFRR